MVLRQAKDISENAAWGEGLIMKDVHGFEVAEPDDAGSRNCGTASCLQHFMAVESGEILRYGVGVFRIPNKSYICSP
jgi:hypothetical protein